MRNKCPVCKSKSKAVIKKIRLTLPEYFCLPNEYDVVVCEACGFCYAATEATLEDYDYYYSHCNTYSGTPTESKAKTDLNYKAVKLVESFAGRDMMFLDIGYGKGNFMRLLKGKGFSCVCGMDPSVDSVQNMRKEGFEVYEGSIFDKVNDELKDKFDCVFLFDVLEHLLYPDMAISRVSDYLKENGYLVVSVPNYASLFEDNSILVNQFNQEHINYFSPISLDNLLRTKNFVRVGSEKVKEQQMEDSEELLLVYHHLGKNTCNLPGGGKKLLKDEICRKSIEKYIQRNGNLENVINEKLSSFQKDEDVVYIWGTGAYVMWLLSNTSLGNMKIEAFIDNNPTKVGKRLIGKPIIKADEVSGSVPILICCMKHSQEIVDQMEQIHMDNKYLIL